MWCRQVWSWCGRGVIGLAVRCCMPCVALLAGCLAQCSAAVEAAGCGCQTTAGCICRMLTQRLLHCCAALLAALCRLLLKRMTAPRAHPPTKTSSPCPCGPRPHSRAPRRGAPPPGRPLPQHLREQALPRHASPTHACMVLASCACVWRSALACACLPYLCSLPCLRAEPSLVQPCCLLLVQWKFTATPVSGGGPAVTVTSPSPDVRFTGLLPDTQVGPSDLTHA